MNKAKRIAQIYNKERSIIVWRKEENIWWITDKYSLYRLNKKEYIDFKLKYCSYVKQPYIKDLEVGQKASVWTGTKKINYNEDLNFEAVLKPFDTAINIIKTPFKFDKEDRIIRMLYTEDLKYTFVISNKYIEPINEEDKLFVEKGEQFSKVNVYDNNENIKSVLMPLRWFAYDETIGFTEEIEIEEKIMKDIESLAETTQVLNY